MKNILLHGLGQTEDSWSKVKRNLKKNGIETISFNLFQMSKQKNYQSLQTEFTKYCNNQKDKLNLCGLSLGGILALDYAKEYPEKVNSLILIGTPYQIPKILFRIQNIIFKITPEKVFQKIGLSKKDFCNFLHSMSKLKIKEDLEKISVPCLLLCGNKDWINKRNTYKLSQNIKNSTFQIISNASHEINLDNPNELANIINHFWNKTDNDITP